MESTDVRKQDLNQCLLNILTCSSCRRFLSPPIHQCWRGHNFCSICKPGLETCPKCNSDFIKSRNLSLEIIATNFRYPCKNRVFGCTKKFRLQDLQQHESACTHQELHECVVGKYSDPKCCWKGQFSDIWTHVEKTHPTKIFFVGNIECVIKNFDLDDSFETAFLIRAHDEMFWFHNKQDKKRFMGAVKFIGDKKKACKFKYEIRFHSKLENDFKVNFSRITHSVEEDIDELFSFEKCMCLSTVLVSNFLDKDSSLHFTVNVISI